MLSNSSGFVPGSQQERHRIQAIGAESLDVNIMGTIPVVSVVLNQNYGGRLIHAFNKFLRPGIVYLALEKSIMAVIGVDAAFDLLFGKKYARLMDKGETAKAEELRKSFAESYLEKARASRDGVDSNLVDWTIPSAGDLREHIINGMKLACKRCNEAFGSCWPE
jgi:acetyl-CoA carboxylase carboxyltransferase component